MNPDTLENAQNAAEAWGISLDRQIGAIKAKAFLHHRINQGFETLYAYSVGDPSCFEPVSHSSPYTEASIIEALLADKQTEKMTEDDYIQVAAALIDRLQQEEAATSARKQGGYTFIALQGLHALENNDNEMTQEQRDVVKQRTALALHMLSGIEFEYDPYAGGFALHTLDKSGHFAEDLRKVAGKIARARGRDKLKNCDSAIEVIDALQSDLASELEWGDSPHAYSISQ